MGILDIPNELLLLIGENLSIRGLSRFLSTCRRLRSLLTPRLHKLGLRDLRKRTALQWALLRGHFPLAELAISRGAEVNKPDWCLCMTPLHFAAKWNHDGLIRTLVGQGARTTTKDILPWTPLHVAADSGAADAARVLLELGADMICINPSREMPAETAARNPSVDCMKVFLDAGFDINTRGPSGGTVLHKAARFEGVMLEYLLRQKGAKALIDSQDRSRRTPLHQATFSDSPARVVRLLLHHGADMYVKDIRGETPVHIAATLTTRWLNLNVECLRDFIDAGFDFNTRGHEGQTILHRAVYHGKQMLELLLEEGRGGEIMINAQDDQGLTPLHVAGHRYPSTKETVSFLIRRGADPEIKDSDGNTPAQRAANLGRITDIEEFGRPDGRGRTCLVCWRYFPPGKNSNRSYKRHLNAQHLNYKPMGIYPFLCPDCPKTFSLSDLLAKHNLEFHREQVCARCQHRFVGMKRLREHLRSNCGGSGS